MGVVGKISKRITNTVLKKHILDLDDSIQEVNDIAKINLDKVYKSLENVDSKLREEIMSEYKNRQQLILESFVAEMKIQKAKMNNFEISLYDKLINI